MPEKDRDSVAHQTAIERVVEGIVGGPARVVDVTEDAPMPQGESGSAVRSFSVAYRTPAGRAGSVRIVTKNATRLERRVLALLASQGQAIPFTVVPEAEDDGRALVFQEFAEANVSPSFGAPFDALTERAADALAAIHAGNLGAAPRWLPRADRSFLDELYLRATRVEWGTNLADPAFAAEFGRYTDALDRALDRLLDVLAELTRDGRTLTLINTDITPAHVRLARGRPCFIDWEQANHGPLYLDLPNLLSVETALLYRDALTRHGHEIPPAEFLERYREVGRYMGLRYLEVGLLNWRNRGADWPRQRWFLYFCLTLALGGR